MTEGTPQKPIHRRGRIFPERTLLPEELARRKAEDEPFYQRCRQILAISADMRVRLLPPHLS